MATFRPNKNDCELNFDDKHIYYLPLNEDTADNIDKALRKLENIAPKNRADIDAAYNTALDVIDDILGDGQAENVMSIFNNPGTLEVWDVLAYIMKEWRDAYQKALDNIKTTMPTENRETRRGRR